MTRGDKAAKSHGLRSATAAESRAEQLRREIEHHTYLYYALDAPERLALGRPLDAREWRMWQNGEPYLFHYGLRLEEVSTPVREAILAVLRASLSEKGYDKTRHAMWLNGFLGDIVHGPAVMGEWSYIFCLFGEPSATEEGAHAV